jgi:hypothetical protein
MQTHREALRRRFDEATDRYDRADEDRVNKQGGEDFNRRLMGGVFTRDWSDLIRPEQRRWERGDETSLLTREEEKSENGSEGGMSDRQGENGADVARSHLTSGE